MIKSLQSRTPHLTTNVVTSYIPYNANNTGVMRYSTGSQCIEVSDGSSWYPLNNVGEVSLSMEAEQAINWAREQMRKQQEIESYAQKYPAVRDLKEQLDTTNEKLAVVLALVKQQPGEKEAL